MLGEVGDAVRLAVSYRLPAASITITATDLAAGMGAVTTRRPFWRVVFWNMAGIVVRGFVRGSRRGEGEPAHERGERVAPDALLLAGAEHAP